ncbi:heavy metal-binding domain-containing protein [uncultured Phenylobacterium sp.]|uniref:heavy metal-binding domain-containing protein n=1 Tax=uncultured Phenylobacterium sp. TaxID=349273 RepID=UPI0025ECA678|nr:heavy metal-binding domain-containing protein [uncultured Phenylobacterium sp.]
MAVLSRRVFVGSGVVAACACVLPSPGYAQSASGKYVCPPCGCDNDGKVFDAPGECSAPGCGMTLIPEPPPTPTGSEPESAAPAPRLG